MTFDEAKALVCPKCGSEEHRMEYWAPPIYYGTPPHAYERNEMMKWECSECRFQWESQTKDHAA